MKKNIYIALIMFLLQGFSLVAQSSAEKDRLKKGNKAFENENYIEALPHFQYLLSLNDQNPEYNFKYGACLVYKKDVQNAYKRLSYALDNNVQDNRVYYFLGKLSHLNYAFNTAVGYYNQFKANASDKQLKKYQIENEIRKCSQATNLLKNYSELKVYSKKKVNRKDFYRSYDVSKIGGKIIITDEFQSKIDKRRDHHPVIYLSNNQDIVLYASYGDNDDNGKDLYLRRKTGAKFGKAIRLPDNINTPYDEEFPYLSSDGSTLYFSSKGHMGLGGFDIFKTTYDPDGNSGSDPVNMDFKINSPDDDLFFIATPSGDKAYFASSRETDDSKVNVYDIGVKSYPLQNVLLAGNVTGSFDNSDTQLKIEAFDADGGGSVGKTYVKPSNPNFLITLPKGGKYKFKVSSKSTKQSIEATVDVPFAAGLKPLKLIIDYKFENQEEQITLIKRFNEGVDNEDAILASYFRKIARPEVNPEFNPEENVKTYDKSFVSTKLTDFINLKETEQLKLNGQLNFAKENAQTALEKALQSQNLAQQALDNKEYEKAQQLQIKANNEYLNAKSYANNVEVLTKIVASNESSLDKSEEYQGIVGGASPEQLNEISEFVNANQKDNIIASVFQKEYKLKQADLAKKERDLKTYNEAIADNQKQQKFLTEKMESAKKREKKALQSQLDVLIEEEAEYIAQKDKEEPAVNDLRELTNQLANDVLIAGEVNSNNKEESTVSISDVVAKLGEYKQTSNLIEQEIVDNGGDLASTNTNSQKNTNSSEENSNTTSQNENSNNTESNNNQEGNNTAQNTDTEGNYTDGAGRDSSATAGAFNETSNKTQEEQYMEQLTTKLEVVIDAQEKELIKTQKQTNYVFAEAENIYDSLKAVEKQLNKEDDVDKIVKLEQDKKRLTLKTLGYADLISDYQAVMITQNDDLATGQKLLKQGLSAGNEEDAKQYFELEATKFRVEDVIDQKIRDKKSELAEAKSKLGEANTKMNQANNKLDKLNVSLNEQNLSSEEKQDLVREITQTSREIEDLSLAQKSFYNKSNTIQNEIISLLDQQDVAEYIKYNQTSKAFTDAKPAKGVDSFLASIDKNVSREYIDNPEENLAFETFDMNSEIAFLTKMEWVQSNYDNLVEELDEIGDNMKNTPKTDRKYAELKNKTWVVQNRFFEKNFDNQLKFFDVKSDVATKNVEGAEEIRLNHQKVKRQAEQLINKAKGTKRLDKKNEYFKKAFTLLTLQDNQLDSLYDVATYNEYGLYVDKSEKELKNDIKILKNEYDGLMDEVFNLTKQIENEKDQNKRNQILEIKVKKEILARNKKKLIDQLQQLIDNPESATTAANSNDISEASFFNAKKERESLMLDFVNNSTWADDADIERFKAGYEELNGISLQIEKLYKQKNTASTPEQKAQIQKEIDGLNRKLSEKENVLFVKMIKGSYDAIADNNKEIGNKLKDYNPNDETAKRLEELQRLIQSKVNEIDSLKAIDTDDKFELARLKRELLKRQAEIITLQKEAITEIDNNPSLETASGNNGNGGANGNGSGGGDTIYETNFDILVDENGVGDYDVNAPVSSEDLNILQNVKDENPEYRAFLKEINILIGQLNNAQKGSDAYKRIKLQLVEKENDFLSRYFYDRYEAFSAKAQYSPVAKNAFPKSKTEAIKHDAEELFLDAKNSNDLAIKNNLLKQAFVNITQYELQIDSIENATIAARKDQYGKLSNGAIDQKVGGLQQSIFGLMAQIDELLKKYENETDPYKKQQLLRERKRKEAELQIARQQIKEMNQVVDERNGIAATNTNPNNNFTNQSDTEVKNKIDNIQAQTSGQIKELKGIQNELESANNKQQELLDRIGKTDDPDEKKELYDEYQSLKDLIAKLQAKLNQIKADMERSAEQLIALQNQLNNTGSNGNNTGQILLPTGASNDPASFTSVNYVNQFKSNKTGAVVNTNSTKNIEGLVYKVQVGAFYTPVSEDNFKEFTPITYLQIKNSKYVRYYAGKFSQFNVANNAKGIIRREKGYGDAFVVAFYNGQKVSVSKARRLEKGDQQALNDLNYITRNSRTNTANTSNVNTTNSNTGSNTNTSLNTTGGSNNTTANTNNNTNTTGGGTNTNSTTDNGISNSMFFTVQIGALSTPAPNGSFPGATQIFDVKLGNGYIRYNSGKFKTLASANNRLSQVENTILDAFVVAYYNGKRVTVSKAQALLEQYGNSILIK